MNKRLTFFLLVITAALGGWYVSLQNDETEKLSSLVKREGAPEYRGEKISSTVYDTEGKIQYFAKAREIKRYEQSEITEFFEPELYLYDPDSGEKQWQVTANQAEITNEKILHLMGDVQVKSLDPHSRLQQINTAKLSVNLETQDIFSDTAVRSTGLGFTSSGTGLTGNLKKQLATLTKDVKTYLEPTILNSTNGQ